MQMLHPSGAAPWRIGLRPRKAAAIITRWRGERTGAAYTTGRATLPRRTDSPPANAPKQLLRCSVCRTAARHAQKKGIFLSLVWRGVREISRTHACAVPQPGMHRRKNIFLFLYGAVARELSRTHACAVSQPGMHKRKEYFLFLYGACASRAQLPAVHKMCCAANVCGSHKKQCSVARRAATWQGAHCLLMRVIAV